MSNLEEGEDGSDVFLKAHVNHAVGLVQTQIATHVQVDDLLVQHVHEAAGSCHHDVDATAGTDRDSM